jgi:hypothetical protein
MKAEQSFDLGFVFDIKAKQTCLFQNLERSKRSEPCLFYTLERLERSKFCLFHKFERCVLCVGWSPLVEYRNTTIQSEPFIRYKQDGCSDKTESYRFWRNFSSLQYSRFLHPTAWWIYLHYTTGITMTKLRRIFIKCRSPH